MHIEKNYSLKPFNTFHIDVNAKLFATFSNTTELQTLLTDYAKQQKLVIGGGSNILLTQPFEGIVLKNEIKGIHCIKEDGDYYYVQAAAGEVWHNFVLYCIENNYAGVENLSLIPGCVGASPMQNIGAYGVEIKDVFFELEAMNIANLFVQKFNKQDCAFDYRESVFKRKLKDQFIILNVTFRLPKHPVYHIEYGAIQQELEKMHVQALSIKNISQAVINIRSSKLPDPGILGNAGSFFKNPTIDSISFFALKDKFPEIIGFPQMDSQRTKVAAGWLIEQCGYKGFREQQYGVHENQALVLVNYGHATGAQILHLSSQIIQSVQQKFGITLEREVNII